MKQKRFIGLLLLVSFVLAALLPAGALAAEAPETVIRLFHTNDVHGAVSENIGYAKLKAYTDSQQADIKLLVDAGDLLNGMPLATVTRGEAIARLAQAVGYDAICPGNHDFDFGFERLLELQDSYALNLLSANTVYQDNHERLFAPYIVREQNGIKVGIFGLTTPETAYKTAVENVAGIQFGSSQELIACAAQTVQQLTQQEDCDIIVALTHLGSEAWAQPSSAQLAAEVSGIDVIVDGHGHSVLENMVVNETHIVSAGEYMQYVGDVTITVKGDEKTVSARLLDAKQMEQITPDAQVSDVLNSINSDLEPQLNTVVASAPLDLDGERANIRSKSTNLGRVVTASMQRATGADIAMINSGSIRTSIAKGDIKQKNLIAVMPFGNYALTVSVTGAQILQVLERTLVPGAGAFPQFYGMKVSVDTHTGALSDGSEYTYYTPRQVWVGGESLDPDKTYTVAINDYMYHGGDGYDEFAGKMLHEYGTVSEMFIDYIQTQDIEIPAQEDNLIFLNDSQSGFVDVAENTWFFDSVSSACAQGFMKGISETEFAPEQQVTRGMFITVLARVLSAPEMDADTGFSDVNPDAYYASGLSWALSNGLVQGCGDGTFQPEREVTREEMAQMLFSALKMAGKGPSGAWMIPLPYTDAEQMSEWAVDGIAYCTIAKIMQGDTDGSFYPKQGATRAETAQVAMKLAEFISK